MALRAITPSREAYCSKCQIKLSLEEDRCPGCGEDITGVVDASLCGNCRAIITIDSDSCSKCGMKFEPIKTADGYNETEYLRRMLQWRQLERSRTSETPVPTSHDSLASVTVPIIPSSAPQPINILYELAEPLEKVVRLRKKRLQQMDELIAEAKHRLEELGETSDPLHQKEKARLRRWIDETQAEREDLATIENSMMEMEKIYKNLLALQQVELQTKEEGIRIRLDSVRAELERMEREKLSIQEREDEIKRREDELRKILERIDEKEKELSSLERLLTQRVKEADEQKRRMEETQKQIDREKWMAAQKQIQSQLITMKTEGLQIQTQRETGEMSKKLAELEEQMERLAEEKSKMVGEKEQATALISDVGRLLKILDELLGQLPKDVIRRFAASEDFKFYEKTLDKCGV